MPRFRRALLRWYGANARDLPWRRTGDPYPILVSEVLLQQTRVEQALGYYTRFLAAFPNFAALAQAPEEDVLRIWAGAGYYRRARNLHRLAQAVAAEGLPHSYAELLGLPGVGSYTAAAVASIAFGEPVALVDGNVRRVLSRLWAEPEPSPRGLRERAEALLFPKDPGRWNQALMELGSLVCTPKRPNCPACPVARFCAGQEAPERYPAPRKRSQRTVSAAALVLRGPQGYLLERREGTALGGLWGFPLVEGEGALPALLARYGLPSAQPLGTVTHAFTHKRLTVRVYTAPWNGSGEDPRRRPLSALDRKILALVPGEG
ncbi:MAG: A/G-specific adenine glycosylase [Candidatus Bipolaricaulota bacterium]|nr:A/G-specific adenine glycosylase [Candidatus Bipolaricaulota bacterium]